MAIDPAQVAALPPAPPRLGAILSQPGASDAAPGAPMPAAGGMQTPMPAAGAPPPGLVPLPEPAPPPQPPATIQPGAKIAQRPAPENISNPFERTASMIVTTAEDWAQGLAKNLGEHPSDYEAAPNETVHEMIHFSPYGTDAPSAFWRIHDELLATATAANDPDPYAVAERGAMDEVYPYRSKIALLDVLNPEQRVKRAEELMRISQRQVEQGNPHTALPSIVGPMGLPESQSADASTSSEAPKSAQGGY